MGLINTSNYVYLSGETLSEESCPAASQVASPGALLASSQTFLKVVGGFFCTVFMWYGCGRLCVIVLAFGKLSQFFHFCNTCCHWNALARWGWAVRGGEGLLSASAVKWRWTWIHHHGLSVFHRTEVLQLEVTQPKYLSSNPMKMQLPSYTDKKCRLLVSVIPS